MQSPIAREDPCRKQAVVAADQLETAARDALSKITAFERRVALYPFAAVTSGLAALPVGLAAGWAMRRYVPLDPIGGRDAADFLGPALGGVLSFAALGSTSTSTQRTIGQAVASCAALVDAARDALEADNAAARRVNAFANQMAGHPREETPRRTAVELSVLVLESEARRTTEPSLVAGDAVQTILQVASGAFKWDDFGSRADQMRNRVASLAQPSNQSLNPAERTMLARSVEIVTQRSQGLAQAPISR